MQIIKWMNHFKKIYTYYTESGAKNYLSNHPVQPSAMVRILKYLSFRRVIHPYGSTDNFKPNSVTF